ncbi:MAG: AAA family ATPase, partial [Armatimonadetes bacterium]|nr:AAA family ATPase [Armatimonadota bacterium]
DFTIGHSDLAIKVRGQYQDIGRTHPLSFTLRCRKENDGTFGSSLEDMHDRSDVSIRVYYTANRTVRDTPLDAPGQYDFTADKAYEGALDNAKTDFRSFFQWFRYREDYENETRIDNDKHRDVQLEAVRQALTKLIPGYDDLRVRRNPLGMVVTKGGTRLLINQLSDGEKCLIAMVGDIARRYAIANPNLTNPLEGYGVAMIDEIELHLHPGWQRAIIPRLESAFPNCQFIVTTHSPQVISEVKKEGVYLLKKDGTVERPSSSYGRDSNSILEELMGVSERPEKFVNLIKQIYREIDSGEIDKAKAFTQELLNEVGEDEPELVRLNMLLKRKEALLQK